MLRSLAQLTQHYLREMRPTLAGSVSRFLYAAPGVQIGANFRADTIPRILADESAHLEIGRDVEFRSGVEIRAHGHSRIIVEDGVRLDRGVRVLAANEATVLIGAGSRIGLYTVMNGGDSITIGPKSLVSGFVYLQTSMHKFDKAGVPIRDQGYEHAPVVLGEGAWLGAHVVVMPGVRVGDGAVVGSNAVVTRDVDARTVAAGVPAKPLESRDV